MVRPDMTVENRTAPCIDARGRACRQACRHKTWNVRYPASVETLYFLMRRAINATSCLHVNTSGYLHMSNPNNDCFRIYYAVILLGSICLAQIGGQITDAFNLQFPVLLIVLTVLATLTYIVGAFLYNLVKLNWKHLLSILAAVLAAFSLISLQDFTGLSPGYLRFVLLRPYYIAQVNEAPPALIRFKAWFWNESGGGIIGGHQFDVLIYDETEQLLLLPELRTDEWISAVETCSNYNKLGLSEIATSGRTRNFSRQISIKVLGRHFFLVSY